MAAVARPQPNVLAAPVTLMAPPTPPTPRKARTVRDTFLNMLGEFVALSKTPDFKLSPTSNQFIAEAIRGEIRAERQRLLNEALFEQSTVPRHTRTISTSSYYRRSKDMPTVSLDPNGQTTVMKTASRSSADRRQSLPVIDGSAAPPLSFFQRVRRLSQRKSRAAATALASPIETPKVEPEPIEGAAGSLKTSERRHKSRGRRDPSKSSRKESADETQPREHRRCRHHSASGGRRHRRSSAPTADTVDTDMAATIEVVTDASERRRAARVRKHKISAAAMIADVKEETDDN